MQTVILGAGISGLTAAYALSRIPGASCSVYEEGSAPGGLCQTHKYDGFTFDAISHVLHFRSAEAEQLAEKVVAGKLTQHERRSWIYFRGRYIPYPFQSHLGFLPFAERVSCLTGYLAAYATQHAKAHQAPENFEEWIHSHFGTGIARHFMTPYNTKLWRLSPREMSADWVRAFVPTISIRDIFRSFYGKNNTSLGYNSYFIYPDAGGVQSLVDGLAAHASDIHLNHRAVSIDLDGRVIRFETGEEVCYDRVISSVPLRSLALMTTGLPEELREASRELRCTSLLSLNYCLRRPLPHRHHWTYFPEPEFPFFRLVFPSNISASHAPPGCGIICAEVSDFDSRRIEEINQQTRRHLRNLRLIESDADIILCVKTPLSHAYPVHDLGRQDRVDRLLDFFKSRGIWSIGRFGGWRYSSIDDAMAEALQVVRELYPLSAGRNSASTGNAPPVTTQTPTR